MVNRLTCSLRPPGFKNLRIFVWSFGCFRTFAIGRSKITDHGQKLLQNPKRGMEIKDMLPWISSYDYGFTQINV